ncbi:MAG: dipeptide ABC transporter ATP-binding protein [Gaiellaceae bacterium]
MSEPLLEIDGLRIESRAGNEPRTIVGDMSLRLAAGETVGIVGESGSGKSMTARAVLGLLPPGLVASGTVAYQCRQILGMPESKLRQIRGGEISLVLQDPFTMLNPLRRCGRHVVELLRDENGGRLGRTASRMEAIRRLAEVGIADPGVVDRYPFQLSGGMRQRVGLAAALARDPRVLIADEPSTALDVTTQKEILALLSRLQEGRGMGVILITHDLRVAFENCDRIYVLYAGALVEVGPSVDVEAQPLHPYTLGLLLSEPPLDRKVTELPSIPGAVPRHEQVADRCVFSARCPWVQDLCTTAPPPLVTVAPGRVSACVRLDEIRDEITARRSPDASHAPVLARVSSGAPLITVRAVAKRFANVVALDGVTIEVEEGESVGIVGESGSGKTTLARCLVGLERPDSGTIEVAGVRAEDLRALSSADRRRLRQSIQIVFQDPYSSLNPVRTVGAALTEALAVGGRPASGVGELLGQVGLPVEYQARKPAALSGGERQRVAIARALAVQPKVIVCDEPVSALDVSVQAQILNLLARLRERFGLSYVFITHDLAVARQATDRVYVLYRGKLVESGSVDDVLDRPAHAYTKRLVESVPGASPAPIAVAAERLSIEGGA